MVSCFICNKFVKNGGSKETVDYLQNILLPAIGKALGDDVIAYNVDMFPFVYANDDEHQTMIQLVLIGDIPSSYGDIFIIGSVNWTLMLIIECRCLQLPILTIQLLIVLH